MITCGAFQGHMTSRYITNGHCRWGAQIDTREYTRALRHCEKHGKCNFTCIIWSDTFKDANGCLPSA